MSNKLNLSDKPIEDFGEKIGGARKDLAGLNRSLTVEDIQDWTEIEKKNLIVKNQLWKAPNYKKMVEEGLPIEVAFYIKNLRDSIPSKPFLPYEKYQHGYIEFVGDIKDKAMALKTMEDVRNFFKENIDGVYVENEYGNTYSQLPKASHSATTKFLRASLLTENGIKREIENKQFLYSAEEKALSSYKFVKYDGKNITKEANTLVVTSPTSKQWLYCNDESVMDVSKWKPDTYFVIDRIRVVGNNFETLDEAKQFAIEYEKEQKSKLSEARKKTRKQRFTPPQLDNIVREGGEEYRNNADIRGEDMLRDFKFRGGEFGNWQNQNDRQTNLNMSYDAFKDLAVALDIRDKDISLGGHLAIAYGARGVGLAVAHYEPERNVINLTKMRGAGSLAHEWAHALDYYIAKEMNLSNNFATQSRSSGNILTPIINAMKWKESAVGTRIPTDYLKASKQADRKYSKDTKGYWSSDIEMFARAFASYVNDKLADKGIRCDYLCGHSECSVSPQGEERRVINAEFDKVIEKLKEMELLRSPAVEEKIQAYQIYQVKDGDEYRNLRFQPFDEVSDVISQDDYKLVYEGSLNTTKNDTIDSKLEGLFSKFNTDLPADFKGHSLSMSDVITIDEKAYYVDRFGFKEVETFFDKNPEYTIFRLDETAQAQEFAENNGYHVNIIPKSITGTDNLYFAYKDVDSLPEKIQDYARQKEEKLNEFIVDKLEKGDSILCSVESTDEFKDKTTPFNDKDGRKFRMVAINTDKLMIEAVNDVVFNDEVTAYKELEKLCDKHKDMVIADDYCDIVYEVGRFFVEHAEYPSVFEKQLDFEKELKQKKNSIEKEEIER